FFFLFFIVLMFLIFILISGKALPRWHFPIILIADIFIFLRATFRFFLSPLRELCSFQLNSLPLHLPQPSFTPVLCQHVFTLGILTLRRGSKPREFTTHEVIQNHFRNAVIIRFTTLE